MKLVSAERGQKLAKKTEESQSDLRVAIASVQSHELITIWCMYNLAVPIEML